MPVTSSSNSSHPTSEVEVQPSRTNYQSQPVRSRSNYVLLSSRLFVVSFLIIGAIEAQSANSGRVIREAGQIDIRSNTPRPMSATVFAFGEEFGWAVDYEDPQHSKTSPDVYDMTDPDWKSKHPDALFIGLRGGSFTTHLAFNEAASTATPIKTVERVVNEYNESSLPGRFSVRLGADDRIAVIGIETRTSSGRYEKNAILLDTPVEMTASEMTLQEALSSVTSTLEKLSGHRVEVGTAPVNLLLGTRCVTPSGRLSSRVAIGQILDSAPVKLAYYLLYDLNDDLYVLNIGVITRVTTDTHGKEERSVVRQPK